MVPYNPRNSMSFKSVGQKRFSQIESLDYIGFIFYLHDWIFPYPKASFSILFTNSIFLNLSSYFLSIPYFYEKFSEIFDTITLFMNENMIENQQISKYTLVLLYYSWVPPSPESLHWTDYFLESRTLGRSRSDTGLTLIG